MEIKEIYFTYMLFELAKEYVKIERDIEVETGDKEMIELFNRRNNFTPLKCKLLPFLVVLGNGHKQELTKAFGDNFEPKNDGIIQTDIEVLIDNNQFEYLSISHYQTTFKSEFYTQLDNYTIEELLLIEQTNKIEIQTNFEFIKRSIKSIIEKKLRGFPVIDEDVLSYWSTDNFSWRYYNQFEQAPSTFSSKSESFKQSILKSKFALEL